MGPAEGGERGVRELQLLSVVTPMYFEEDTVAVFYERMLAALGDLPFELVVVNDGSTDRTPELLDGLAESDPRVKVIHLSRNFGHQAALSAGLDHAAGDCIVMIDADLQDPPELIPKMVDAWRHGTDVVYAVREEREGETRAKLMTAKWFYALFAKLASVDLTQNSGDFRLMDRRALDAMLSMPERNRFLRGMSVWVGFTQTAISYPRDPRHAGETKYTWKKMIKFSLDAITSFSHVPLQLATIVGFVCAAVAFCLIPLAILARIFEVFDAGVPTLLTVILLIGGIQLLCLGIVGEYIGRIYDEVKGRPLYVVGARRNVEVPERRGRKRAGDLVRR
ncbi:glycosyltransferase family 2 protein [Conexibacter sp. SYSU D00693]|uniref:glycosyltransferase family 2 protein n=1 Tax=Conexibacter sp. SYSU D00693 TaxID=2812560 RepID=UPI00196B965A|nr:glycosyltransferase family 2 protein [Conexibacter sp. SYSU D00693]